jgi:hypothetical protein
VAPYLFVIPSEARNLSRVCEEKKERFLARRSGFGMTIFPDVVSGNKPKLRIVGRGFSHDIQASELKRL